MKDNRILYVILIGILVVSCIIIGMKGFNKDLKQSNSKQIIIYIGKEFDNKEIKALVKEAIGNRAIIIQKVEAYEEIASITVDEISDEEIKAINEKLNKAYDLENTVNDIVIQNIPSTNWKDLVKPYIFPIAISLVLILVYATLKYRKIDILEVLGKLLGFNVLAQLVYISILAILRLPINVVTIPTGIVIFAVITMTIFNEFERKEGTISEK